MIKRLEAAGANRGHVDLMQSCNDSRAYAVKKMPNSWVLSGPTDFDRRFPSSAERPWQDVGLLRELSKHDYPYMCEVHGVFRDATHTYVVTTFAEHGDLFAWCKRASRPGPRRERSMLPLVRQIFDAVERLHQLGISHRDLSVENILLTSSAPDGPEEVKLIDFGQSFLGRTVPASSKRRHCSKAAYRAPETLLANDYDAFLADAFALGVVVHAMAVNSYPWESTKSNTGPIGIAHTRGVRYLLADKLGLGKVVSEPLLELVVGLLQLDPSARLGVDRDDRSRRCVWEEGWLLR